MVERFFSVLRNTYHLAHKRMDLKWNMHLCRHRCMCTHTQRCSSLKRANTFTVRTNVRHKHRSTRSQTHTVNSLTQNMKEDLYAGVVNIAERLKGKCERNVWELIPILKPWQTKVSPSVYRDCVSFIQYSTRQCFGDWAWTGLVYASILCMAFMQMKRWQWAKPLIWVSLWLQRLMQQKHHESTGKQNRGSSVEIVHRIGGTW